MTAQIPDSILLQAKKFSIAGVNGASLFYPLDHDMQPLPSVTSCWRGFVCAYRIADGKLLLDLLQVSLGKEGPVINDIRPVFSKAGMFDNIYNNLDLPMDFTGGILAADGFIRDLYVHMGFHPAWKYETVIELTLAQGNVLATTDLSREMAELRAKLSRQPLQPGRDASEKDIASWIASTFKRNYRF